MKLIVQNKFSILILLFISALTISSCTKEDIVPKPTVSDVEIGHDNNKKAYPGADLHIEGNILAPGNIASITLEIHPETGTGWKFEKVFTEGYAGLKNAEFHEHIHVPEDATLGEYHLHLKITDQKGNTTEIESHLDIVYDPTLPSIAGFEVEYDAADGELHIEGDITAPNKIAEIEVEIHGGTYEKEFAVTGDYVGKTTFHLHKHFDVAGAPAGHYHVHLKVKDQAGKEVEFEEHFDK